MQPAELLLDSLLLPGGFAITPLLQLLAHPLLLHGASVHQVLQQEPVLLLITAAASAGDIALAP